MLTQVPKPPPGAPSPTEIKCETHRHILTSFSHSRIKNDYKETMKFLVLKLGDNSRLIKICKSAKTSPVTFPSFPWCERHTMQSPKLTSSHGFPAATQGAIFPQIPPGFPLRPPSALESYSRSSRTTRSCSVGLFPSLTPPQNFMIFCDPSAPQLIALLNEIPSLFFSDGVTSVCLNSSQHI